MQAIEKLIEATSDRPEEIEFTDVMEVIENNFEFTPVAFRCGDAQNEVGTNEGSCKILAFAKMYQLSEGATLSLFGRYYRSDVLQNPQGDDHSNIRNFIIHGWSGVSFESEPLVLKAPE